MKKIFGFISFIFISSLSWAEKSIELTGAGATFPYPLYSKWFYLYHKKYGIKVNYQSIGSGGGIRQLIEKTVDFGATDAVLTEEEHAQAKAEVLHLPTCIGAVVIAYNLPIKDLKLTPEIISNIFLGKIKKWNDERIRKLNPKKKLPDMAITIIHRSDSSGTTFIFSEYLSKTSKEWEKKVGKGKSLRWPCGLGAKGNEGVTGLIKQIPGSVGYIELAYAIQNKLPVALIKNKAGRFIKPTLESISQAANIKDFPPDAKVSLTDTLNPNGYPICSFTWLIFYKEQNYANRSKEKAIELVKLLRWIITEGQKYTKELLYAPLPKNIINKLEKIINSIVFNGKPILK